MSIRRFIARIAAKFVHFCLKLAGKGATALPGKIAIKICPNIIELEAKGKRIITITGTNGKTTTTHMIADILADMGYEVCTNSAGANLAIGIATAMICKKTKGNKGSEKVYVLEVDEGAFSKIAGALNPEVCLVTNIYEDQLDRYGSLDGIYAYIKKGIEATKAKIVINGDNSYVNKLETICPERTVFYGLDGESVKFNNVKYADKVPYLVNSREDSNRKWKFDVKYDLGSSPSVEGFTFDIGMDDEYKKLELRIPGFHNLYNTCAAVAAITTFVSIGNEGEERKLFEKVVDYAAGIKSAFGRMEKFRIDDKRICMLLVKNPAGYESSLDLACEVDDLGAWMVLLNNTESDGRDISWIENVDFEGRVGKLPEKVYVSGSCYKELGERLTKAGFKVVAEDTPMAMELFKKALSECPKDKCLYLLPNYTAMFNIRGRISEQFGLKLVNE